MVLVWVTQVDGVSVTARWKALAAMLLGSGAAPHCQRLRWARARPYLCPLLIAPPRGHSVPL